MSETQTYRTAVMGTGEAERPTIEFGILWGSYWTFRDPKQIQIAQDAIWVK